MSAKAQTDAIAATAAPAETGTLYPAPFRERVAPGSCAGFPAGGTAHHLVNRGPDVAVYLEIGDRSAGDEVEYPDDDLAISFADGQVRVTRKDGTSY